MKKFTFIMLLIFFVFNINNSYCQWQTLNPNFTIGETIRSICFTGAGTGYVCGDYGKLAKTTNSGTTWQAIDPVIEGSTSGFYLLNFPDPDTGYMSSGYYLNKTTDAGATWTSSTTSFQAISMHFFDTENGVSLGSVSGNYGFFSTDNGGVSWVQHALPTGNYYTNSFFLTPDTGYIVGQGGVLLKTADGGINWQTLNSGISWDLISIYFYDANNGWITSTSGRIYHSTDQGATWSQVAITGISFYDMTAICFADPFNGYAIGQSYYYEDGCFIRTTNGGISWTLDNTSFNKLYSLTIVSNTVFVGGDDGMLKKNSNLISDIPKSESTDFSIFPNPTAEKCIINIPCKDLPSNLSLYNQTGEYFCKKTIAENHSFLNLRDLPAGIYFIDIENRNGRKSRKIVKL